MKLKCILLDDELPGLAYLKMLCQQIDGLDVVKAYSDPQKLLEDISRVDFDLCILDIEMPGVSGLQVARHLSGKLVIFTTAYKEFAAEAFDLDAVDYVRKPVQKARLQQAIAKAFERASQKHPDPAPLQLNTNKGRTIVHPDQIGYIDTSDIDSRDKTAVMLDGSSLLLKNISFEQLLGALPTTFCRINKRQAVALKIVASYTFGEITTSLVKDGVPVTLSLSEAYRKTFQQLVTAS